LACAEEAEDGDAVGLLSEPRVGRDDPGKREAARDDGVVGNGGCEGVSAEARAMGSLRRINSV
jgi:hypothetical protein